MTVPPILILMIPLSRMAPNPFYFGVDRLRTSWQNLFQSSVSPGVYPPEWAKFMEVWVMPAVALLVIIAAAAAWKKLEGAAAHALVFAAGSMTLAVAALVVGHRWAGLPYPFGRTGLYLVWLGLAAWLAAVAGAKVARSVADGSLDSRAYSGGAGCAFRRANKCRSVSGISGPRRSQAAVRQLRELQAATPKLAQVGGSWEYIPGLNYYRLRYRLRWMAQVNHGGLKEGFDYYVLTQRDGEWVQKLRLRKVWRDLGRELLWRCLERRKTGDKIACVTGS
jgi:hypothetical protein